jgi:tripartite-type tricarboxylate transporter receptor subunit TctC
MMSKIHLQSLVAATAVALSYSGFAYSQEAYPSKPIRLMLAIGPGAGADNLARFLAADPLRRELGTEIIVENRAGAGGVVGGDYLAKSKPDGYTIALLHASVVSTATVVNQNVNYDPIKDFTPIANLVTNQLGLVVNAGSKWQSLEQMLAEAKRAPRTVNCGLIGIGSHTHFNVELLKLASGAEFNLVPYAAGTGPILSALMGNQLDCTSLVWPAVDAYVKAGKFRALAVTSPIKELPQIPTFASKGYPQVSLEVFNAIFAPAGLPREVQARLETAFSRVMNDPKVIAQLEKQGYSILYEDSKKLAERVRHELGLVRDVFKRAGMKQQS